MAELRSLPREPWRNFHSTVFRAAPDRHTLIGNTGNTGPDVHFAASAACLKPLIEAAMAAGSQVATIGTKWSFSDLLAGDGGLLETDLDQGVFDVDPGMLAMGAPIDPARLVIASGGTKIATLNAFLEHGTPARSLNTSGSFNGQSIAGMLGTGVHGSALHFGPFQNHVRGIHVITDDQNSVWIEPGPAPLFDPTFVNKFADKRIVDPAIFAAALVHIGGMGIINAVALEVRDSLRLDVVRLVRTLDRRDIELLQNGDYRAFTARMGHDREPYYIELTLSPFTPFRDGLFHLGSDAAITLYFESDVEALGEPPVYGTGSDPLQNILEAIETYIGEALLNNAALLPPPALAIAFLAIARVEALTKPLETRKTWGEVCGEFHPRKIGNTVIDLRNDAFAVPREKLLESLIAVRDAFPIWGGGHLVATVRFVSGSRGTLAFTRFDDSAVINLDGLRTPQSRDAVAATLANLDTAGIPFSQHWGKMGVITCDRIAHEFGPDVPGTPLRQWRDARAALLPRAAQAVFKSKALEDWGLT
jgi:hypothetical protein